VGYTTGKRRRPKWKKPKEGKGKKVVVWLTPDVVDIYHQIENKSAFFQIALREAVGVMTWALMKEAEPEKYYNTVKLEDVIDDYNVAHPVDPLTKARQEKKNWRESSQKKPEIW
jgi:hypothetical protein